jgi:hypothetical protein
MGMIRKYSKYLSQGLMAETQKINMFDVVKVKFYIIMCGSTKNG